MMAVLMTAMVMVMMRVMMTLMMTVMMMAMLMVMLMMVITRWEMFSLTSETSQASGERIAKSLNTCFLHFLVCVLNNHHSDFDILHFQRRFQQFMSKENDLLGLKLTG